MNCPLFYSHYLSYYIRKLFPFFSIFSQRFLSFFLHKERNTIFLLYIRHYPEMSHLLSFRSHSGYYWNTYSCFHLILNPSTPYIYLFLFTQREKYYLLLYIRHYPEMSHLTSYRSHSYFTSFLFTLFNSSSHAVPKLRTSFSTPTPKKKLSILLYTQTIYFLFYFSQKISLFYSTQREK